MSIVNFLLRPHPFDFSIKRISAHVVIAFLSVFFVLFVVQPFNINETTNWQAFYIAFNFACVCPIVIYPLELGLLKIFPLYYSEKNWTVYKTIFHLIIVIAFMSLGNYLVSILLYKNKFMWQGIVYFLYPTIAVGIIPITISVFFSQYIYYKKYNLQAISLNFELQTKLDKYMLDAEKNTTNKQEVSFTIGNELQPNIEADTNKPILSLSAENFITFRGQNKLEVLNILPNQLIYCCAADNYVDFFYLENNKVKRQTQRNTLTNISEVLVPFPFFIKCHRSYLVNLTFVKNVFGNAQGLRIMLQNIETEIPVSRSMTKEIPTLILQFAKK
jgi:DNA-binding LytR/AlgR family response regulator